MSKVQSSRVHGSRLKRDEVRIVLKHNDVTQVDRLKDEDC